MKEKKLFGDEEKVGEGILLQLSFNGESTLILFGYLFLFFFWPLNEHSHSVQRMVNGSHATRVQCVNSLDLCLSSLTLLFICTFPLPFLSNIPFALHLFILLFSFCWFEHKILITLKLRSMYLGRGRDIKLGHICIHFNGNQRVKYL